MKRLLLVIIMTFFLSACVAQQQDIENLDYRLATLSQAYDNLERRLASLEKEVATLNQERGKITKAQAERLEGLSRHQAELATEVERLRAEMMRIDGRLEELAFREERSEKNFQQFQAEIISRLDTLETQVSRLSQKKVLKEKARAQKEKVAKIEAEMELYDQALELFKKGRYQQAKEAFQRYLEQYPQGKRVANAIFWIGECEYQLKRFEEAILEYQKVIEKYPQSIKVPAAMLKQGLAFLRLGDTESAKIIFRRLLKRYPHSEQAKTARSYLKKLR